MLAVQLKAMCALERCGDKTTGGVEGGEDTERITRRSRQIGLNFLAHVGKEMKGHNNKRRKSVVTRLRLKAQAKTAMYCCRYFL